ncbi:hypothetical protein IT570_14140 [Candidatus Sumerlaeota bacterium]|nr:hypothetical protein [Candidatus Sumerlaeota bacterium]
MYDVLPSFILGFHGCDHAVAEEILSSRKPSLQISRNTYDWLGHGLYFWENSPERARLWSLEKQKRLRLEKIEFNPAVIGAIIDPGLCLNLLDSEALQLLPKAHKSLSDLMTKNGQILPTNITSGSANDLLIRDLDCAVLELLHILRKREHQQPFDTVRGMFVEGREVYPGAGFHEKNHIQICVRNPRCLKGFFRVLDEPDSDFFHEA